MAIGDGIVVLAARAGQTESGVAVSNVEHTCVRCSNPLSLSDQAARRLAEFYCCWECEAEIAAVAHRGLGRWSRYGPGSACQDG